MGQVAPHLTARPRGWTLVSALLAPVALVGGWLLAGAAQPPGYDPVRDTISALAADGATDRAIMTTGLAALGAAHLVTALGLRGVRVASRIVLGAAGLATVGVAVFEQPVRGSSPTHVFLATVAFVLLALWPATTAARGSAVVVRPAVAFAVTLLSLGLLAWFGATLGGGPVGLSERVLSAQQALWPLVGVLGLRSARLGP